MLKRLRYKNYKDRELQSKVRLFTLIGFEITELDLDELFKQHTIIFTIGDDFDYSSRINALRFKKHLGKGGFGMVDLRFDDLTNQLVAVKQMSYESNKVSPQMVKKEFDALSKLTHKNIVSMIGAYPQPAEQQLIVVMEYLAGGELYDYWVRFKDRRMPESEVAEIMLQMTEAVEYCHNKGIIHRDLKFQNVLLSEEIGEIPSAKTAPSKIRVKVADFGIFGSNAGEVREKHNAGSLRYMAPEILKGRNESDPKLDVWSLGVMMFAMITG